MGFEEDLKEWREVEIEFATRLLKHWASMVEIAPNKKFSDWDIKAKQWTLENFYEVKDDKTSRTSWNVGFEYICNWKPSWIYVSKSDFITYKVDGKFYCVPRAKLLIRLEFVKKEKRKWGDWDKVELFIVEKSEFFSFVDRNWWVS